MQTNLKCKEIAELLPLYLDNLLNDEDQIFVQNHLSECENCSQELEYIKGIISDTKKLPQIEPSEEFHKKLHSKLISVNKESRKYPIWKIAAQAAVGAAVVALCVFSVDNVILNKSQTSDLSYQTSAPQNQNVTATQKPEEAKADKPITENKASDFKSEKILEKQSPVIEKEKVNLPEKQTFTEPTAIPNVQETAGNNTEAVSENMLETVTYDAGIQEQKNISTDSDDTDSERTFYGSSGGSGEAASGSVSFSERLRYKKKVVSFSCADENEKNELLNVLSEYDLIDDEYNVPNEAFESIAAEFDITYEITYTEVYDSLEEANLDKILNYTFITVK